MALNIGRKMTDEDKEKLEAAAVRFCAKWEIDTEGMEALDCVPGDTLAQYPEQAQEMRKDWNARVKRALGGYTSWGYGYVGHDAK
jgi:hypothetical protein